MNGLRDLLSDLLVNRPADKILSGNDFEDWFRKKLMSVGYSEVISDLRSLKDVVLNDELTNDKSLWYNNTIDDFGYGYFVTQPFGSQSYPDFILSFGDRILPIEVKVTTKTGYPMWNGGLPRPNGLYVFYSKSYKDVTFFMGDFVLDRNTFNRMKAFFKQEQQRANVFNASLPDPHNRGFVVYPRAAFAQTGRGKDFFKHPDRRTVEQLTLIEIEELMNGQE